VPFPGAESALSGVAGEGVAMFSPGPAYGPNSGNENSLARPTGSGNCDGQITEGFSSKKVQKSTRFVPKLAISV
jgi:hypothetical protein